MPFFGQPYSGRKEFYIYKWAQEDTAKGKAAPKQGIPDYSCKEGESL